VGLFYNAREPTRGK